MTLPRDCRTGTVLQSLLHDFAVNRWESHCRALPQFDYWSFVITLSLKYSEDRVREGLVTGLPSSRGHARDQCFRSIRGLHTVIRQDGGNKGAS